MKENPVIKIFRSLDSILSICSLAGLISVTFSGVIWRYIFQKPFIWQEEVQLWLIVWTVCFGSSIVFRSGGHIGIDIIVDMLPKSVQKVIQVVVYILVISLLGFLLINSIRYVQQLANSHRVTGVLKIPYSFIYSAFPIGIIMMFLSFSQFTYKDVFKVKNQKEELE